MAVSTIKNSTKSNHVCNVATDSYNLMSITSRSSQLLTDNTFGGITFKAFPDYSFSIKGTANQKITLALSGDNGFTDATPCRMTGCTGGSASTYYFQSNNGYKDTGSGVNLSYKADLNRQWLIIENGTVIQNEVRLYPQLVLGNTSKPYQPYGRKIPAKYNINVLKTSPNLLRLKDSPRNEANYNPTDTIPIDYNKVYWMAGSGYFRNGYANDIAINGDTLTFTMTQSSWYGLGFPIKVKPSTKYTISGIREEGTNTKFLYALYDNTGKQKSYAQITANTSLLNMSLTITTPADVDTMFIIAAGTVQGQTVKIRQMQVTESDTRLPYSYWKKIIKM